MRLGFAIEAHWNLSLRWRPSRQAVGWKDSFSQGAHLVRDTRYQGAIIRDHHILLIQQRNHRTGCSYWLLPGGGIEGDETEEACVIREMKEETHLDVRVERLVLDEPLDIDGGYKRRKTYLCRPVAGVAKPGHEPEPEAAAEYTIAAVRWLDLRDESGWDESITEDPFTFPQLRKLSALLGTRET